MRNTPTWNPSAKSASIRKWVNNLHKEARRVFLQDKTHVQILFLFKDEEGIISVNPIQKKTNHAQVQVSICNAVKEHDLYAVIHIGEAWTYFPKKKDHTAFQLLDGEIRISDLNDEDKTEALYIRMESKNGDCMICLDRIIRDGDKVNLDKGKQIWSKDVKWFE